MIPKTYTLRQLRELGEKWLFVDLFLDSLEQREEQEEGTKVPEMKIDPGKPFVPAEGMKKKVTTHLLYPITVLESERDNSGHLSGSLLAQLNKAIDILVIERYEIVKKELNIAAKKIAEDESKKKRREALGGVVDKHLFKK